jgi:hypothetical protein
MKFSVAYDVYPSYFHFATAAAAAAIIIIVIIVMNQLVRRS